MLKHLEELLTERMDTQVWAAASEVGWPLLTAVLGAEAEFAASEKMYHLQEELCLERNTSTKTVETLIIRLREQDDTLETLACRLAWLRGCKLPQPWVWVVISKPTWDQVVQPCWALCWGRDWLGWVHRHSRSLSSAAVTTKVKAEQPCHRVWNPRTTVSNYTSDKLVELGNRKEGSPSQHRCSMGPGHQRHFAFGNKNVQDGIYYDTPRFRARSAWSHQWRSCYSFISWLVWGCKSACPKERNVRTSPSMMADYGRDLGYIARGENEACHLCWAF